MRRSACVVVMVVASLFGALQAHAVTPAWSESRVRQLDEAMTPARDATWAANLQGQPTRALEHIRGAVDQDDWLALFLLANNVWTMYPAESFEWHQRAFDLSGGDHYVRLELALHYTRHEQCDKAIDAWTTLDSAGLLGSHMPMLAGYCYLQLGQDARAFEMFHRSRARHGGFEKLLEELWGGPHVVIEHARRIAAFDAEGDPADLDAALANVLQFDAVTDRGQALLVITDAAVRGQYSTLAEPLRCLQPVFEQEASAAGTSALANRNAMQAAWRGQLVDCRLLIEGHPLPENSGLMKFLVTRALNMQIASPETLLAAHAPALKQRATAAQQDREALEVLAALQERAGDPALAETDMLGWETYGLPAFAMSRVSSEIESGSLSDTGKMLLARAYAEFPHDARILHLWLQYGEPDADAARQGWRELALLQFHAPSIDIDGMHVQPVARTLYLALHQYADASGFAQP